jgi:hypothetical protein
MNEPATESSSSRLPHGRVPLDFGTWERRVARIPWISLSRDLRVPKSLS